LEQTVTEGHTEAQIGSRCSGFFLDNWQSLKKF